MQQKYQSANYNLNCVLPCIAEKEKKDEPMPDVDTHDMEREARLRAMQEVWKERYLAEKKAEADMKLRAEADAVERAKKAAAAAAMSIPIDSPPHGNNGVGTPGSGNPAPKKRGNKGTDMPDVPVLPGAGAPVS